MDNNFTAEFGVIEFTTQELRSLTSKELEFLLAVSLIINDIRFYWSLLGRSRIDGNIDDLKILQSVRDLWLLRKLSAVIVESQNKLHELKPHVAAVSNLIDANVRILPKFEKSDNYLELAKLLRTKITYHYAVGDLGGNLQGFGAQAKHSLFAHNQQGNSISAICEQILTLPTIRDTFEGSTENGLQNWCLKFPYCLGLVAQCSLHLQLDRLL